MKTSRLPASPEAEKKEKDPPEDPEKPQPAKTEELPSVELEKPAEDSGTE